MDDPLDKPEAFYLQQLAEERLREMDEERAEARAEERAEALEDFDLI